MTFTLTILSIAPSSHIAADPDLAHHALSPAHLLHLARKEHL
ncbi:hypothetical protein [Brevibacterium ravenspurgense]|nr:hypothetical protein [Brevibacterium ravenspurgense]